MKKLYACSLLLALALAFAAPLPAASAADTPNGVAIGAMVEDFKLPDAAGRASSLSSLKGAKGTVLIFISVQCPVSNAYNERMEKLARDYKARGVNVVGINSNATEAADAVKQHATEHGFTFTVLKDAGNKIADRLGARVTPEAYFLDADNKLVYRGRIDNADPRRGGDVTSDDLRDAIEATLAGKPVVKNEGLAFGCSIKRAG
jgi:peroxiredoxin